MHTLPFPQTQNFWQSQNQAELSAGLAPKWYVQPGFSCATSATVLVIFVVCVDVALARSKDAGKLLARAGAFPSHVIHHISPIVNVGPH